MSPTRLAHALAVTVAALATVACLCHLAGHSAREVLASAFVGIVALVSTSTLGAVFVAAAPRRLPVRARAVPRR